ncbi:uncharacterized protein LOC109716843 [Ananas comosus]|uniref:Uncharacterized protein LOC109716843 n=1 Tax=Ananas comosus TaxID=4615 RepID=A0A6P5FQT3_ANACO|nr:uncharacterized protein LOC109716843 [Ananas comosus]
MAKPVDSEPLLPSALPQPYYASPPPPYYSSGDPPPPPPEPYLVVLPIRLRRRIRLRRPCCSLLSSALALPVVLVLSLALALFLLWPSDPDLSVARLRLDRVRVVTSPEVALTVALGLRVRVRNPDFFALHYDSLSASIAYRGRPLGNVASSGGRVRARAVSYVDAELELDAIRVIGDVFYLIEDLARGSIPLETVTEVKGRLRLFFFDVPVQGRISCSVYVNPENQTIIEQDCYPE